MFQIFVGWSKEPSRSVAKVLADWLNNFFGSDVRAFQSDKYLGAGKRIENEISNEV